MIFKQAVNQLITMIKDNGLKGAFRLVFRKVFPSLNYFIEQQRYYSCLRKNVPYFGEYMAARQGDVRRHYLMEKIVEYQRPHGNSPDAYYILEVGSWAGGSAITWAEAIKKHNHGRGMVLCVDPWESYLDLSKNKGVAYKKMEESFNKDGIFQLFLHNIRATHNSKIIRLLRGQSSQVLPFLKESKFHLVYIDGSHAYDDVLADIRNVSELIQNGGILCGDDLELQSHEIDINAARTAREKDFIQDPKTKNFFHPGVTLAVADSIGEVSSWNGFWAVRKTSNGWKRIVIPDFSFEKIVTPSHFKS